jgi:hypothetical protein
MNKGLSVFIQIYAKFKDDFKHCGCILYTPHDPEDRKNILMLSNKQGYKFNPFTSTNDSDKTFS